VRIARVTINHVITRIAVTDFITRIAVADFVTRIATFCCKQVFQPFAKREFFTADIITTDFVAWVASGFITGRASNNAVTRTAVTGRARTAINKFFET
jgi:hypothetical protein